MTKIKILYKNAEPLKFNFSKFLNSLIGLVMSVVKNQVFEKKLHRNLLNSLKDEEQLRFLLI